MVYLREMNVIYFHLKFQDFLLQNFINVSYYDSFAISNIIVDRLDIIKIEDIEVEYMENNCYNQVMDY